MDQCQDQDFGHPKKKLRQRLKKEQHVAQCERSDVWSFLGLGHAPVYGRPGQ